MILAPHPDGHVAVTQAEHAAMAAAIADSWGNERFGTLEPREPVRLAAERHEMAWEEWDRSPELDPATGLPFTVSALDPVVHLPMQVEGPRRLGEQSAYAGLLASLKHASMYERPSALGMLRSRARHVRAYLDASCELQADLRARVDADDAEVERNWRLVRTFDALSHDLLLDRAPCARSGVPAAAGAKLELSLERHDGGHTLDPWPFASGAVTLDVRGRMLEGTFSDEERMRTALASAPEVVLTYELVRAS